MAHISFLTNALSTYIVVCTIKNATFKKQSCSEKNYQNDTKRRLPDTFYLHMCNTRCIFVISEGNKADDNKNQTNMKKYQEFTDAVVARCKDVVKNWSLSHVIPFDKYNGIERKFEHLLPAPYNWKELHREIHEALEEAKFYRRDYGIEFTGDYTEL